MHYGTYHQVAGRHFFKYLSENVVVSICLITPRPRFSNAYTIAQIFNSFQWSVAYCISAVAG